MIRSIFATYHKLDGTNIRLGIVVKKDRNTCLDCIINTYFRKITIEKLEIQTNHAWMVPHKQLIHGLRCRVYVTDSAIRFLFVLDLLCQLTRSSMKAVPLRPTMVTILSSPNLFTARLYGMKRE